MPFFPPGVNLAFPTLPCLWPCLDASKQQGLASAFLTPLLLLLFSLPDLWWTPKKEGFAKAKKKMRTIFMYPYGKTAHKYSKITESKSQSDVHSLWGENICRKRNTGMINMKLIIKWVHEIGEGETKARFLSIYSVLFWPLNYVAILTFPKN